MPDIKAIINNNISVCKRYLKKYEGVFFRDSEGFLEKRNEVLTCILKKHNENIEDTDILFFMLKYHNEFELTATIVDDVSIRFASIKKYGDDYLKGKFPKEYSVTWDYNTKDISGLLSFTGRVSHSYGMIF